MKKCLIIRFSSFGDIVQLMSVLPSLKSENFNVHWITKKEFAPLVSLSSDVEKVWGFDKNSGVLGLIQLIWSLRDEHYTHIYDAHQNIRSLICTLILRILRRTRFIYRSKNRWKRFLLFKLRINKFGRDSQGMLSYHTPLRKKDIIKKIMAAPVSWQFDFIFSQKKREELMAFNNKIVLAPFAAWKMKTWPKQHWIDLVHTLDQEEYIVLGGKKDEFFLEFENLDNVVNLVGKLSLIESCYLVSSCKLLISADTGLLHVADILGVKGIALMGPTAFGFPTNKNIITLEKPLLCRPCSKDGNGRCSQAVYQKCMVEIDPLTVAKTVKRLLNS